jgi:hypothetical protein
MTRCIFIVLVQLGNQGTVVIPKEGQMRFAAQASRSMKFATFWVAENINNLFLNIMRYLRKLELRITWPSFGNTTEINSYPTWRLTHVLLSTLT